MKLEVSRFGSPARDTGGSRCSSSVKNTRICSRAKCAPRHECGPCPNARWSLGSLAGDVEAHRVGELPLVVVRRHVVDDDLVAAADVPAGQFGRPGRRPPEGQDGRMPAQHLLDRASERLGPLTEKELLLRMLAQRQHTARRKASCGTRRAKIRGSNTFGTTAISSSGIRVREAPSAPAPHILPMAPPITRRSRPAGVRGRIRATGVVHRLHGAHHDPRR